MFDKEKVCIVLSGVSGSGKSAFAGYLADLAYISNLSYCICTADDYFIQDGVYKFNPLELGIAHKNCQEKFEKALRDDINLVICANTNCGEDSKIYYDLATKYNYTIISPVLQKIHNRENVHEVNYEILKKQHNKLLSGLKLL